MYFFNNKIAFKKPPSGVVPLPGAEPQNYRFNAATGFPQSVEDQATALQQEWGGKPLQFSNHVMQQANAPRRTDREIHSIHPNTIPNINKSFPLPEHGFAPAEIEHDGKNITKLLMRGPLDDSFDVTMPVIRGNNGQPFVTTLYGNKKNDDRQGGNSTLDLNRVHLPEEFSLGKRPRRRLSTETDVKQPNYQAVPATRQKSRQRIIDQYGIKS